MREKSSDRFEHEVYSSFNIDPLAAEWKDNLIQAISQQLEITSSLRGLKRWNV